MARVALFTGQIRNQPELLEQLELFRSTGLFDRLLVSTWANHPQVDDLRRALEARSVELILSELPTSVPRWSGTRYFQIRSLEAGLDAVDPNDTVFKTRHEVFLPTELVADAVRSQSAATAPGYSPFQQRVWVGSYRPTVCFYIDDKCFLGLARDLRLLCDHRRLFDIPYGPFIQREHVTRWGLPLVDRFPVFRDYLSQLYAPFSPLESWLYAFPRARPGYGGQFHKAIISAYLASADYLAVHTAFARFVHDCLLFSPIEHLRRSRFRAMPLAISAEEYLRCPTQRPMFINEAILAIGNSPKAFLDEDAETLLATRLQPERTRLVREEVGRRARAWFWRHGWRYAGVEAVARVPERLRRLRKLYRPHGNR